MEGWRGEGGQGGGGGRRGYFLLFLSYRLDDQLMLMEQVGVCFKLTNRVDKGACFLFPSLASYSGMTCFIKLFLFADLKSSI